MCFVKVLVLDTCDDLILTKIFINESKSDNSVVSNFLLPMKGRKRVMIAGNGEKCIIKNFTARNIDLKKSLDDSNKNENVKSSPNKKLNLCERNPACCMIF
jgi:hypothetical protein